MKASQKTNTSDTNAVSNIIILCDGDFPTQGPGLQVLRQAAQAKEEYTVIACDGAFLHLLQNNIKCDYIVGDMDTLPKKYHRQFKQIIHKEEEQDYNDLAKAFRFANALIEKDIKLHKGLMTNQITSRKKNTSHAPQEALYLTNNKLIIKPKSVYNITILGATGKREDHALGNISYLPDFAKTLREKFPSTPVNICMITDYGVFVPILGTTKIKGLPGSKLSIFSFDQSLRICSTGLMYKTHDVVFDMWWKATLNIFRTQNALLKFSHPAKALLYFPF